MQGNKKRQRSASNNSQPTAMTCHSRQSDGSRTFRPQHHHHDGWPSPIIFIMSRRMLMAVCSMAFLLGTTGAFSVSMQYQPPVKSSVNKLSNPRMPRPSGSSPSASSSASSSSHPDNRQASRKQAFASIYAPEAPTASFEQRMRQLALGTQAKTSSTTSLGRDNCAIRPRNVHVIESLADYKKIVGEEKEKVVAVRFHATWCRACKAVAPHFYHLAAEHKDIVFVDVPVTHDSAVIHKGLGVPSLPFGHIYHPQHGLVEELKLTRKDFQEFKSVLLKTNENFKASVP